MLLYTIMPYDAIFAPGQDMQFDTRRIPGGFLQTFKTPQGDTVSRLISTDPRLYLRPDWMPGAPYRSAKGNSQAAVDSGNGKLYNNIGGG